LPALSENARLEYLDLAHISHGMSFKKLVIAGERLTELDVTLLEEQETHHCYHQVVSLKKKVCSVLQTHLSVVMLFGTITK